MKIEFKFKVDTSKSKKEKKHSLSDLKGKAENAINSAKEKAEEVVNEVSEKAAPKVKEAQEYADKAMEKAEPVINDVKERAKGFLDKMLDFAEKTAERVEDYIDQKLAEEKEEGPDDITEEFFESDDEEETEEEEPQAEEPIEEETETEDAIEGETETEETVEEETDAADTFSSDAKPKRKVNTISLEEFLDKIVGFKKADKEPDISEETEGFLWAIKYFSSEVSKVAFKAAVNLPKITYVSVINAIEKDFPEMTKREMRNQLQTDFKNWVNVRYPELKEKCPNANCMTLLKYWAKKFKEF